MKRRSDIMFPAKPAAVYKSLYYLIVKGQIFHGIACIGMGFKGQYLAVDPKILDIVIATISQGIVKRVSIVPANFGKVFKLLIPGKGLKIFRGCSAEFNGFFTKNAAQS
jgi:hypothetical protein